MAGNTITMSGGKLTVPNDPVIPFIEGDGTGPDIWRAGVPSPVKHPEKVDMVIFRENTEDIYAGIEYAAGTPEAQKVLDFLQKEFPKGFDKIRFGSKEKARGWLKRLEEIGAPRRETSVEVGIGFKPISYLGTDRLAHSAIG